MDKAFEGLPFRPADILLPRNCDLSRWSVVACDQYTSQPEYWQRVAEHVGKAPSALRLILPESSLDSPDAETDIMEINNTMSRYLREDRFDLVPDALIYVERTLRSGRVRRGLVGMVDLEQYDYEPGSSSAIRASEGTVLSRVPPRMAVRKNAPIELPHVLVLADDREDTLLGPLAGETGEMERLYDFELMEQAGHLSGWRLTAGQTERFAAALRALGAPEQFLSRYGTEDGFLLAVGDGNHSLATAKECCERQKRLVPPEHWDTMPARFALVELANLHDPALEFLPIHRVVFGADPEELLDALCQYYPGARRGEWEGTADCHVLPFLCGGERGAVTVFHPKARLHAETLQDFLDAYLRLHPAVRVDYIHGEDVAEVLAAGRNAVAFLLPAVDRGELFPTILRQGAMPRKTFSIGRAEDKRFYLEARKIR